MDNTFNDFLKDFGEKVKTEREAKNLTLKDMEFHTGIDDSDFNKIELGKTNITFRTFLKVAKGLKVQPKKLVDFDIDLKNENLE
ncbi:XRE family transcriptional regulator [Flavobacterium cupreum]|uniref:Helix-turn-helix transcriptional regulator n=3 Tax=Flavobacterium TaxID=237 RepID=A0A940XAN8_9FLAO|nr:MULTISPECIES: helix-turn-helix transcriptional regulator [Flavobacterium]MBP4139786.1 helix-turn-helix transcriptional regulator [Flavobacterium geliluteum]RUT67782.1 XRE family transcriptional regulator [Flavobacterium cupreum]TCN50554.1 helix-turn-helix protein [Flavobacterium circumlabens]TDO68876.1 helix-turn-helix protein [Flavobacterium sp. P3160]TEB41802.1 XRE family transcriptional regulator [Flavobacterium circumlabens]